MWGQIAAVVASAVINKKLAPKPQPAVLQYSTQTETNDANLEVMRQKAEEAGFNPLTVLRAGGINAYATRKTNIPSYVPQLSKGPSYLEVAAGAAAMSYFNRPTEQQKATTALKTAQQFADLDYTRAMTDQARNSGSDYKMNGTEIGGVYFEDLPLGAEPFYDPDGKISRDENTGKYLFKGDGFTSGLNWATSIPALVRYTINPEDNIPITYSNVNEDYAGIADPGDLFVSGTLHVGAVGSDAVEKVMPRLPILDNFAKTLKDFIPQVPVIVHKGEPIFK